MAAKEYLDKAGLKRLVELIKGEISKTSGGSSGPSIHYVAIPWPILAVGFSGAATLDGSKFDYESKVGDLGISQNGVLFKVVGIDAEYGFIYCDLICPLKGTDGKDGITPHIGENGNWWIGETDTGVAAGVDPDKYATTEYVDTKVGNINTVLEAILGV